MNGVLPFVVRRLLAAIPVLIAVTAATFFLGRFAPGDPITIRTGGRASPEVVARIKHDLHLDENPVFQYFSYMGGVVRGDFGYSDHHPNVKVSTLLKPKIIVSFQENVYPFILTFLIGLPLGIYLALRRGTWQDPSITALLLFFSAIPVVLLIPVVQYVFSLKLGWLPAAGWHGLLAKTVILPTVVLTVPGLASVARLMRISLLQVMDDDFVRTARAKGLSENTVIYRHMLRNSLLPTVTMVVTDLFFLFAGSLFVELLFGIPGIANETIQSIFTRDYNEFMALTILFAVLFIVANVVVDISYSVIDPRIRLGSAGQ